MSGAGTEKGKIELRGARKVLNKEGSEREVRCRGLHLRCSCTVGLELSVLKMLFSLRDVHKGEEEKLYFIFLVENSTLIFSKMVMAGCTHVGRC